MVADEEVLFAQVLRKFRTNPIDYDIYELVESFRNIAMKKTFNDTIDQEDLSESWVLETKFWGLVKLLIGFRYSEDYNASTSARSHSGVKINSFTSDLVIKESILNMHPELRELSLIQQWLVENFQLDEEEEEEDDDAEEGVGDKGSHNNDILDELNVNKWLNTKIDLETNKPNVVKFLDPDAIIRSKKLHINEKDSIADNVFYKRAFKLLVESRLDELKQLCLNTSNLNFKLIINGSHDYFNPNIDDIASIEGHNKDKRQKLSSFGIKHNVMFKKSLYKLLNNPRLVPSVYERGCYGYICGDFNSVKDLAQNSWERKLLFYTRNLYEYEVTNKFIEISGQNKRNELNNFSLPIKSINSINEALNNLNNDSNPQIQRQSYHPIRILIGSILSNNLDKLFSNTSDINEEVLRIVVHFIIFMRLLDENLIQTDNFVDLIKLYINKLIQDSKFEEIPTYLTFIPVEDEVVKLHSFIIQNFLLFNSDRDGIRHEQIKLIRELNLPLESILMRLTNDLFKPNENQDEETDLKVINTIQWLVDSKMINESIYLTNEFIENCLSFKKISMVEQLMSSIDLSYLLNEFKLNLNIKNENEDELIATLQEYQLFYQIILELKSTDENSNHFEFFYTFLTSWSLKNLQFRNIYIPMLFNEIFDKSVELQNIANAMSLINLLSSSQYKLYELFSSKELESFLSKVGVLSVDLFNSTGSSSSATSTSGGSGIGRCRGIYID